MLQVILNRDTLGNQLKFLFAIEKYVLGNKMCDTQIKH